MSDDESRRSPLWYLLGLIVIGFIGWIVIKFILGLLVYLLVGVIVVGAVYLYAGRGRRSVRGGGRREIER